MKSLKLLFLILLLAHFKIDVLQAQVPQAFSYQAVARDASGEVKANANIRVQVNILQGSDSGTVLYTESHSVQTSEIGSFSIEIGNGTSSSSFSGINWTNGPHYLSMAVDLSGGTNYINLGATKLLSVPFALVAGNSMPQTKAIASSDTSNIGFSGEAIHGDSNNFDQRGIQGIVRGNGTGTHIGVFGSVVNLNAPAGTSNNNTVSRKYGLYGQAASKAQENIGLFALGAGEGSGDIQTDLNNPNPGSVNSGVIGWATGNKNFNLGVRGRAYGNAGARENVGVQGFSETAAAGRNVGVQSFTNRSQSRNIGFLGSVGFDGSSPENYGMLLYVRRGEVSIGAEIHADKAIITYGDVEINGNITYTGSSTQASDFNLKENITPITNGLDLIMKLSPSSYNYRWNNDIGLPLSKNKHYGLIAQDVEILLPSLVLNNTHRYQVNENNYESMEPDGAQNVVTKEFEYKSLNYTELIPFLIKAVQEQQEMLIQQQKEIEELRNILGNKN
jgi:hypothetical protein